MLSYLLPVEENSSSAHNLNLSLNLSAKKTSESMASAKINGNTSSSNACDEHSKLLAGERDVHILENDVTRDQKSDNIKQKAKDDLSNNSEEDVEATKHNPSRKGKISKIGNKNMTLKRVSFGSSKSSMVETLVFETPTPLSEHAEREFGYPAENTIAPPGFSTNKMLNNNTINNNNNNNNSYLDDSGIEMQEVVERSKVRVTYFQSNKPQQISPPESYSNPIDSFGVLDPFASERIPLTNDSMATAAVPPVSYDRQISTDSGWDNPFRPGGDLSREADEIVNMIKGGKPITPTGETHESIANGTAQKDIGNHSIENGKAVVDGATKVELSHVQSSAAQNGTKSPQTKSVGGKPNGDTKPTSQSQVSNQVIPGPTSASHVVIEDRKKKKCTCCVIQ